MRVKALGVFTLFSTGQQLAVRGSAGLLVPRYFALSWNHCYNRGQKRTLEGKEGSSLALASREVLTAEQVAEFLAVSRKTVYRLIRSGQLIAARVGRQYRIPKSNVALFLASRSTGREGTEALFGRVAEVALRHSFDTEGIELDIAEAVQAVRGGEK
jgi:excisionase family DNA binding protein